MQCLTMKQSKYNIFVIIKNLNNHINIQCFFHRWIKFADIKSFGLLGRNIFAVASGIHVIFINLDTKDEKVEKFISEERGEGACCFAGHPVCIRNTRINFFYSQNISVFLI